MLSFQISTDVALRMAVFRHHFDVHNGKGKATAGSDQVVKFEGKFEEIISFFMRV